MSAKAHAPSEKTIPDLLADLERSLVEAREARDRKVAADDEREAKRRGTD